MSAGERIAGAPISWGVCEVPGWGYQLSPDRVLAEMREVGLAATELGPDGFLPGRPAADGPGPGHAPPQRRRRLHPACCCTWPATTRARGRPASWPATPPRSRRAGAVGRRPARTGYDTRPELDEDGWRHLLGNLDRLAALAAGRGVRAVLHPHVGTMVENGAEVQRVLDGSSISLCLDTGHLLIGGTDPAELARPGPRPDRPHPPQGRRRRPRGQGPGRPPHLLPRPSAQGMYRPLGPATSTSPPSSPTCAPTATTAGTSWSRTPSSPRNPTGDGPVADVWTSAEHLRTILSRSG